MARIRRRFGRRKFRRPRKFNRRVARVARRTIRKMAETKFWIREIPTLNATAFGVRDWAPTSVVQGVSPFTRIGNKFRIKRIGFRAWIYSTLEDDTEPPSPVLFSVRIVVVYPRKSIGTAPIITDFVPPQWNGYLDPTKWVVLKDKTFNMSYPNGVGSNSNTRFWRWSKRVNLDININTAGAVDREPFIVFWSDLTGPSNTEPRVNIVTRFSFIDI
ncbi:MAG: capsid protein [Wigfec virus K19_598]|nr:MAG: capsid protein [Wigfec virus K19_598]